MPLCHEKHFCGIFFEVLKLIFFRRLKKAGLMNVMKAPDHRKCPKKGSVFMNLF